MRAHPREPDMSYVEKTTETVSQYLHKGQLVILGSTTWLETTDELMHLLEELGAEVAFYDSYIPTIPPTREHAEYTGRNSVEWNQATISEFDAVLIATNHSDINYQELADWSGCVIDTRNAMKGIPSKQEHHIFKA